MSYIHGFLTLFSSTSKVNPKLKLVDESIVFSWDYQEYD